MKKNVFLRMMLVAMTMVLSLSVISCDKKDDNKENSKSGTEVNLTVEDVFKKAVDNLENAEKIGANISIEEKEQTTDIAKLAIDMKGEVGSLSVDIEGQEISVYFEEKMLYVNYVNMAKIKVDVTNSINSTMKNNPINNIDIDTIVTDKVMEKTSDGYTITANFNMKDIITPVLESNSLGSSVGNLDEALKAVVKIDEEFNFTEIKINDVAETGAIIIEISTNDLIIEKPEGAEQYMEITEEQIAKMAESAIAESVNTQGTQE